MAAGWTNADEQPLLAVRGWRIEAGGKTLLQGLDLALRPGEALGLAGASGLGKTTLLRSLVGLTDAAEGELLFAGAPVLEHGMPAFRRAALLAAQQPALLDATVENNLRRPFTYRLSSGAYDEARALGLLEALGLGRAHLAQDAHSLSAGQQQRVCLVRALLLRPRLLLLDEPTSALDADAAESVARLLQSEREHRGLGLLIASHDRAFLEATCDEILELRAFSPEAS